MKFLMALVVSLALLPLAHAELSCSGLAYDSAGKKFALNPGLRINAEGAPRVALFVLDALRNRAPFETLICRVCGWGQEAVQDGRGFVSVPANVPIATLDDQGNVTAIRWSQPGDSSLKQVVCR